MQHLRSSQLALLPALALALVACGTTPDFHAKIASTIHPLVAQYRVGSKEDGQAFVEFGTDTAYGRQTSLYDIKAGTTIPILVAGMKPSTAYHMRAAILVGGQMVWVDQDHVFTTQAWGSLPTPTLTVARNSANAPTRGGYGAELVTLIPADGSSPVPRAFATDLDGNPIWFYAPPDGTPSFLKLMPTGHFLVCMSTPNGASIIREIDLAGNTLRELDASSLEQRMHLGGYNPNFLSFHHDFVPLDNGHVVVLGQTSKDFTDLPGYPGTTTVRGDILVDLDQEWNPTWVWNTFDYLDVNRHLQGLPDWTHSNAIVYIPADGNLMLSVRHQSWILGIDYQNGAGSGNLLWRLGEAGDFALAGGDPSQWFYAQHFPTIVSTSGRQMTLAVFDNGNLRVTDNLGTICGTPSAPACFSRATIFQFDQSTMQAQLQWQYSPGVFSYWGGTINQLQNGNIEFEMSAPFTTLGSRVMEVTQTNAPQEVWQMDVTGGSSYRTYRIPSLYPGVVWPQTH